MAVAIAVFIITLIALAGIITGLQRGVILASLALYGRVSTSLAVLVAFFACLVTSPIPELVLLADAASRDPCPRIISLEGVFAYFADLFFIAFSTVG